MLKPHTLLEVVVGGVLNQEVNLTSEGNLLIEQQVQGLKRGFNGDLDLPLNIHIDLLLKFEGCRRWGILNLSESMIDLGEPLREPQGVRTLKAAYWLHYPLCKRWLRMFI